MKKGNNNASNKIILIIFIITCGLILSLFSTSNIINLKHEKEEVKSLYNNRIEIRNSNIRNHISKCKSVDLVYTWVNGSDTNHILKKTKKLKDLGNIVNNNIEDLEIRYRDFNILKYSIRSVLKYASFVNNIIVVTDDQIPIWFNETIESNIRFIDHNEFFRNKSDLPTFNSNAIELNLAFLPENLVSDCFLYLNDDVLFTSPISLTDYYDEETDSHAIYETFPIDKEYKYTNDIVFRELGSIKEVMKPDKGAQFYKKSILKQIYKNFKKEFEKSSSNHFKDTNTDIQLPFIYNQFIKRNFNFFSPHTINYYIDFINNITLNQESINYLLENDRFYKTVNFNDRLGSTTNDKEIPIIFNGSLKTLLNYFNNKFTIPGYWENN